jgi:hypothetical protein
MIIKSCWPKCLTATGDSIQHKEEFLGFPEKDVAEASSTLDNILQVNNLQTWICDETPTAYKHDEETAAEVLNRAKQNNYWNLMARMKKCACLRHLKLAEYWTATVK